MMRKHMLTVAALVSAGALTLSAQAPQSPTPQTPQPPQQQRPSEPRTGDTMQRAGTTAAQVVTITGCLKKESEVPEAKDANGDDYVLTSVKMAQSSTVSGIALAQMYEIEGVVDAELQKHLNHQVEITGRIEDQPTTNDPTPDFRASSLKMVSATCQAGQ